MGLFGHYKQFEGLSEEEVNAGLRRRARERRSRELERVEPLDLRRTTWGELPAPEVVAAITFAARRGLNRYAEGRDDELRAALAARHGVDAARLAIGEGASGLLQRAAHEWLAAGDEVVLPWPCYPLYPLAVRDAGAVPVPVDGLDPERLLDAVGPRTRMLLLGGPGDPTGEVLPAPALAELLRRLPERVVVVVDEALRELADHEPVDAVLRLTDDHPRLVVVRSFSKAWGLAGLRCGYAVASPERPPAALAPRLGLPDLTLAGVLAALARPQVVAERGRLVAERRRRLERELTAAGALLRPSQGPAVWLRAPGVDGPALRAGLERRGVLVQGGDAFGDGDHVRMTVPDDAQRDRVLRAYGAVAGR